MIMNNSTDVFLYRPMREDLWFRQVLAAEAREDAFPKEREDAWYRRWIGRPEGCFYRYIAAGPSRAFVGEAFWCRDEESGTCLAGINLLSRCREREYGQAALALLRAEADRAGIDLPDDAIILTREGRSGIVTMTANG